MAPTDQRARQIPATGGLPDKGCRPGLCDGANQSEQQAQQTPQGESGTVVSGGGKVPNFLYSIF